MDSRSSFQVTTTAAPTQLSASRPVMAWRGCTGHATLSVRGTRFVSWSATATWTGKGFVCRKSARRDSWRFVSLSRGSSTQKRRAERSGVQVAGGAVPPPPARHVAAAGQAPQARAAPLGPAPAARRAAEPERRLRLRLRLCRGRRRGYRRYCGCDATFRGSRRGTRRAARTAQGAATG